MKVADSLSDFMIMYYLQDVAFHVQLQIEL